MLPFQNNVVFKAYDKQHKVDEYSISNVMLRSCLSCNIMNVIFLDYVFCGICIFRWKITFVTGPAKRDQVGTKYTISQNGTYLEFYVQCLLSVGCKMLPMKLLIDGKNFTYIALAGH